MKRIRIDGVQPGDVSLQLVPERSARRSSSQRPVLGLMRRRGLRQADNLRNPLWGQGRLARWARLVPQEPFDTFLQEPFLSVPDAVI